MDRKTVNDVVETWGIK